LDTVIETIAYLLSQLHIQISTQFNRDPEDIPESRHQPAFRNVRRGARVQPAAHARSPADTAEKVNFFMSLVPWFTVRLRDPDRP
jgi:hypothetical protein